MSKDWDSLSRTEKKVEAQRTLRMLKRHRLYELLDFNKVMPVVIFLGVFWFCNILWGKIGGGDSLAAIKLFDFADRFSYISTGGGAMLEYLKEETLPGIKALLS